MTHFTEAVVANWPLSQWKEYRSRKIVRAIRINESFSVETPNGVEECNDGYLILDEDGWPSCIEKEQFKDDYVAK